MAKKTVSEVAKELGIERKDLVGYLEKQSKAKVSAKTTLADDEVERAKEVLGLGPKPQVKIGEERTVTQDVVNETGGMTRETVTERRTTGTLIRRRKVKEAVATEAPGELPPEGDGLQPPPAEMIGEMSEDLPPLPPETPIVPPPLPPREPEPIVVEAKPEPQPAPPAVDRPAAQARPAPAATPTPATDTTMRSARVLGRIDLKKVEPPRGPARPGAPGADADARRARPATGTGVKPAAPAGEGSKDRKGRKKLKVIKKDPLEAERDRRTGRMPRKKRALPGKDQKKTEITVPKASKRVIRISNMVPVGELAKQMGVKAGEVLKKLMDLGMMATITQQLDFDAATLVAQEFDYVIENVAYDAESAVEMEHEPEEGEEARETR